MGINGKKVKKILIRGANWIGDSVISIPAIKAVRQNNPDAFIGLVVRKLAAELLKALPYIDRIYIEGVDDKDIIKEKFELGLLFTNSFSSAFKFWRWGVKERIGYSAEYRGVFLTKKVPFLGNPRSVHLLEEYFQILKTAGMNVSEKIPEFFIPEHSRLKAERVLKNSGFKNVSFITGVCPGASYGPAKVWPKERYLNVINRLMEEKNSHILVFGGPKELDIVNFLLKNAMYSDKIASGPADDILTSAALIQKCGVFITNDTGPMHLAAALGVPTIALFGSTNPGWTGPLGVKTNLISKQLRCSPCYDRECKKNKNKYDCLIKITEEDVFNGIKELEVLRKGVI